MLPFARQIQLTSDFAKNSMARLAGIDPPKFEDTETTMDELVARVKKTLDYIDTVPAAALEGSETRDIKIPLRDRTVEFKGLRVPADTGRCPISSSTTSPRTTCCATTASISASGIFWGMKSATEEGKWPARRPALRSPRRGFDYRRDVDRDAQRRAAVIAVPSRTTWILYCVAVSAASAAPLATRKTPVAASMLNTPLPLGRRPSPVKTASRIATNPHPYPLPQRTHHRAGGGAPPIQNSRQRASGFTFCTYR